MKRDRRDSEQGKGTSARLHGPWTYRDAEGQERINGGAFAIVDRAKQVVAVVRFPDVFGGGKEAEAIAKLVCGLADEPETRALARPQQPTPSPKASP